MSEVLMLGNCLDQLKELPDNSVDAIVTDPPYGLSFMSKKWDYDVPSVDIWRECLRVLKPGGHLLSFGGTRTYHRMAVNIEDAGFEIRDQVMWLYGSGFPKSHNLDGDHEGWGTALKPANEPICLARKPLEKGLTVAENVLKWGTGAINVDASRIAAGSDLRPVFSGAKGKKQADYGGGTVFGDSDKYESFVSPQGRWPANLLLDEQAAEMLDEQSGMSKDDVAVKRNSAGKNIFSEQKKPTAPDQTYGGFGSASRFFYVAKASKRERNAGLEGMPEKLLARSGGAQAAAKRGEHYDNSDSSFNKTITTKNNHPTVKPIKLMEYLIKLVTPPNGIVLDPFMGSGSTGVAAKNLGFDFVGVELSEEYLKIAEKRIANHD